ncbi:uncharacterized protein LOC134576747 [Pelobates fuscus]|uniref:uncharacterized protein LOC134576747 n=1 Tax=Pelobates fuscus TaxID=191477 RepID=UPI002FE4E1A3
MNNQRLPDNYQTPVRPSVQRAVHEAQSQMAAARSSAQSGSSPVSVFGMIRTTENQFGGRSNSTVSPNSNACNLEHEADFQTSTSRNSAAHLNCGPRCTFCIKNREHDNSGGITNSITLLNPSSSSIFGVIRTAEGCLESSANRDTSPNSSTSSIDSERDVDQPTEKLPPPKDIDLRESQNESEVKASNSKLQVRGGKKKRLARQQPLSQPHRYPKRNRKVPERLVL